MWHPLHEKAAWRRKRIERVRDDFQICRSSAPEFRMKADAARLPRRINQRAPDVHFFSHECERLGDETCVVAHTTNLRRVLARHDVNRFHDSASGAGAISDDSASGDAAS